MNKIILLIVCGALLIVGAVYVSFKARSPFDVFNEGEPVIIEQKWELPLSLEEISGIAYFSTNKIAAVQDEEGIIFIYDLENSKIEREISFADKGDYEGIAVVDQDAYVLRSDGTIYEIQNFLSDSSKTVRHKTSLKSSLNAEGLCYDKSKNRLLVAIKDKAGDNSKPIYGFDLQTKSIQEDPAYSIDFNDTIFSELEQKRMDRIFRPSEINIHPETGNIYVLEGTNPKLLIMDPSGKPVDLHILNLDQFPQAEGLTFSPEGDLYISNEGNDEMPNIMKIKLPL